MKKTKKALTLEQAERLHKKYGLIFQVKNGMLIIQKED